MTAEKKSLNGIGRTLVVTDFDGTLVSLQDDPFSIVLPEQRRQVLATLAGRPELRVLIVSGRPALFLEEKFLGIDVDLAAEHGSQFKFRGESWVAMSGESDTSWQDAVEEQLRVLVSEHRGSWIEPKERSLTWHCRRCVPPLSVDQLGVLKARLEGMIAGMPLQVLQGHDVLEVKGNAASKGKFLEWYLSEIKSKFPYERIFVFGDDLPDEEMFKVAGDRCAVSYHVGTFRVGDGSTKSGAQSRLSSPDEVWNELESLASTDAREVRPEKNEAAV